MLLIKSSSRLVFQFSDDEVAVQAGDVADRDVLRTFSLASAGVGTVTESEFIHLRQHSFRTAQSFRFTLRKQVQLADLCRKDVYKRQLLQRMLKKTVSFLL